MKRRSFFGMLVAMAMAPFVARSARVTAGSSSVVSRSFPSGANVGDVVAHCAGAIGLPCDDMRSLPMGQVLHQGWTVHGDAGMEMRRILRAVGCSYRIDRGRIMIVEASDPA